MYIASVSMCASRRVGSEVILSRAIVCVRVCAGKPCGPMSRAGTGAVNFSSAASQKTGIG